MSSKQGSLSINSENIFPIIKKWLYSDHDIFYRELISNGCDAITKLQKLEVMGEYTFPEGYRPRIDVSVSAENRTITVSDNGIGMTFDEVDEYINQIAFSGARDFVEKYKDKTNEDQIIGHFGLGFYSCFMVADRVTIDTLSCQPGATPVFWESDGGTEYSMSDGTRTEPGTTITLYVNEDSLEFCNEYRAKEVLMKYCSFMPIEIYLTNADKPAEEESTEETAEADTTAETTEAENAENADSENAAETAPEYDENGQEILDAEVPADTDDADKKPEKKGPQPINDIHPLWTKSPNDCTEEEYKKFYRTVFNDYKEPLFWIHLNMDYPFRLKGILYFPKVNTEYDQIEGTIKLYNTQVFIADNIKEVIPEFLLLLKGVIDCPDLPLNVSRSALQNDGFVRKISDYIAKKVADKLTGMFKTERETYEKYWDDIAPFLKYGYIRDEKFAERIKDSMLFKNLEGKYLTLNDCLEENKEIRENTVFYISDEKAQSHYIAMFKEQKLDAVYLTHPIDAAFLSYVEQKNEDLHFVSVDSDLADVMKENVDENDEAFKASAESIGNLFKEALNNDQLQVSLEKLKQNDIAAIITRTEESKRMEEMFRRYSNGKEDDIFATMGQSLIVNANHPLVQYLMAHDTAADASLFAEQIYDMALLNHGSLSADRTAAFLKRTNELMLKLAGAESAPATEE